jgi:uncharacterized membrane protein YbhN (UPF0104 family)
VVIDKTIESLATVTLVTVGGLIALASLSMPAAPRILFICFIVFLTAIMVFVITRQKKGFFIWIIDILKKVRIKFRYLEEKREKVKDADTLISEFYTIHRATFVKVFVLYSVQFMLWTVEIYATLLFVGTPNVTFLDAFLLVALGNFAYIIPALPASIGIYEITYLSLFTILGINLDYGISVILVRRIIGLGCAVVGLGPMLKKRQIKSLK